MEEPTIYYVRHGQLHAGDSYAASFDSTNVVTLSTYKKLEAELNRLKSEGNK